MGRSHRAIGAHRGPRFAWVTVTIVGALCVAGATVAAAIPTLDQPARATAPAVRFDPPAPPLPAVQLPPNHQQHVDGMVSAINAARAQRGLAPVQPQPLVAQAAQLHAAEMAARQVMSHTGANGSDAGERLTAVGFDWAAWGENVAAGFDDAARVVTSWMASTQHRNNILGDFEYIGVGVDVSSTDTPYWTITLASG